MANHPSKPETDKRVWLPLRFRIRSMMAFIAIVAIALAVFIHRRNEKLQAWADIQADGVHFHAGNGTPIAEIWVSTVDSESFEVNGEQLSRNAAMRKLTRIRRNLDRLGTTWLVAMDDEPGPNPGDPMTTRQSTIKLVYASGFTAYNYVGQGQSKTIDERRKRLESVGRLFEPPIGAKAHEDGKPF